MEPIQRKHNASKLGPKDFITSMPDNVVTNILDRLPLQDAVRTGILAKNWRFKWTLLSQLVFDRKFFKYLVKRKAINNYGRIISRLLLHLKGVITKFVLFIEERSKLDDEDINQWILFLSRNGIKDLTLNKENWARLKLPTHFLSCLDLKHLILVNCCFDPPASFHGFPNLLSLELRHIKFQSGQFEKFYAKCPVLETLVFGFSLYASRVTSVTIAKLGNLKKLYICLFNFDITSSSSIIELVGSLPKLHELHLDYTWFKFIEDSDEKRFPATLSCLRTLKLTGIDLCAGTNSSCAFEMIRSFTNLQTLEITTYPSDIVPAHRICFPVGLLQLQNVVFRTCKVSEVEVWLIKCLLACSPFLKKVVIHPHPCFAANEKLMFASKLLKLPRASPVAEIDFQF